jgi:F420H(2)-dependent quinone reductase
MVDRLEQRGPLLHHRQPPSSEKFRRARPCLTSFTTSQYAGTIRSNQGSLASFEWQSVDVQVKDEVFRARAYTAGAEERDRLWRAMAEIWPPYDEYAEKTERKIPVVVLERS